MVRYLLGELAEEERIQFEEACFADDQRFEELLAVEAELTDDYVRKNLVGRRRERFEKQLLNTPAGRYEVEFARIITDAPVPKAAAPVFDRKRSDWRTSLAWLNFRGRAFQVSLAALTLVLVGLGLWSFWSFRQTRLQQEQAARQNAPSGIQPQESPQTPAQTLPPGPSPGQHQAAASPEPPKPRDTDTGKPPPEAPAIISLLLVPGFDRSVGGANDLIIPPQARIVRLQLALEGNNYRSYRALLSSVEGKEVFTRRGLKVRSTRSGSVVTLELPATAFPAGDFILTLSGTTSQGEVEDVHKYFLSVRKRP